MTKIIGCPPDYNPGFCYEETDEECIACWRGWIQENKWAVAEAEMIAKMVQVVNQSEVS